MNIQYESPPAADESSSTPPPTRLRRRRRRGSPTVPGDNGSTTVDQSDPQGPAPAVKQRKPLFSIGNTIKPAVVMDFSRQLSSFLQAGIPVLEALEIVGQQTSSKLMRTVISDIGESIHRGTSFSEAIDAHGAVFPAYYRAMLGAAEYTGDLDEVLAQLASYLERDIASKRQVKSALTYPIIVFIVAVVAMFVMSIFVLPKFTGLYESLGANLPLPTRMLMGFTKFMKSSWMYLLGGIGLIVVVFSIIFRGVRGKARRDVVTMKLPVIGHLFQLISLERFCRVLSSLATAGVPLPAAIGLSADSTNNSLFQTRMVVVQEALMRGGGLYEPMAESGLFPIAARQMIQVGERTGLLGSQLGRAASYYEREVTFEMKKATQLFEPVVILFVALIVGFIAVAQIAAMYSIFGQVE